MPTTPTGIISLPLKLTQDLICACATFRTEVAAANAAAAAAFVFWDEFFPENARPLALIKDNSRSNVRKSNTGWLTEGVILVQFDFLATFTGATQDNEGAKIFRNKMGAIEAEIIAAVIANPASYCDLFQIDGPDCYPPDPDNNNGEKFYSGMFQLHYRAQGN
jgi:hypothetical protein